LVQAARRELAALDKDLPLTQIQTLDEIASAAVAEIAWPSALGGATCSA